MWKTNSSITKFPRTNLDNRQRLLRFLMLPISNRMRTTFTRRQWIKTAGAATLALPALATASQKVRFKTPRNLPLAIFTGTYARFPLQEAAQKMRADGFKGVVLQYAFADIQFDPLAPDWDKLSK